MLKMLCLTDICEKTIDEMKGNLPIFPEQHHVETPVEILEIYLIGLPKQKEMNKNRPGPIKLVRANVYSPKKGEVEDRYYLQDPKRPKEYRSRNYEFGSELMKHHVRVYSVIGNPVLTAPESKDTSGRYVTLDANALQIRR